MIEHGISDHGMSLPDAIDLAFDTVAPKILVLPILMINHGKDV